MFAITRHPLGLPYGTLAPEHIATVERAQVNRTLATYGVPSDRRAALDPQSLESALGRLAIGENVTRQSRDYRYSVERES